MKRITFIAQGAITLVEQLVDPLSSEVGRSISSSEISRLLLQGSVYLEKKRHRDPGVPVAGSVFEVFWPDLPIEEFTLDPAQIFWQDNHILVVDKPPGVNSAPSPFSDIDCLTWGVQKLLGPDFPINAIHRLDRDTSGLMLFAKHKEAELALHRMFRDKVVRKIYCATTPAVLPEEGMPRGKVYRWRDTLDFRGKVQSAATTAFYMGSDDQGRDVWTVLPHTGRPHQIRRHFARYLVPLWGDQAYAPGVYDKTEALGLRCVAYRFRHPLTGERLELTTAEHI